MSKTILIEAVPDKTFGRYETVCELSRGLGVNRTALKQIMAETFLWQSDEKIVAAIKAGIARK